jgi:putative nucleotidyltransferase with HDIG domain
MNMKTSEQASADKVGDALRAQRFQMLEDIARELAGDIVFPTSFDAALRLRKEMQNPDLPTGRIAQIVSAEPLVATKLMHMANSVLYSPDGTPARNLQAAISRLGVELVRTTALAIAMNQLIRSKDMAIFSDLTQALWDHTIKTAAAARVLARTYTRINPDEALLAGLVHDLGAFYMAYRAAQYAELRARPDTVKYLIMEWHEGIGVTLLHALGLSEEVVNATIDHDQPRSVPATVRTRADVIYVGSVLDEAYFGRVQPEGDPAGGETAVARRTFAEVLAQIESDAQAMHAVFV